MKYDDSCGAVVFTRQNNKILYVIIQSIEGYYGFPKGHIEGNETEEETALREIFEETGLKVDILPGFKYTDTHSIPGKLNLKKRIVYFVAEYSDQRISYQPEELLGASLMSYDEAMNAFQFENSRTILREANKFITKEVDKNE